MKIKINCKKCNKEIELMPFKIKEDGNYCHSCICTLKWEEKLNGKPRASDRFKVNCMDCRKELNILYSTVKKEGNRCISCSNKLNANKENRYKPHTKEAKEKMSKNSSNKLGFREASINRTINSVQGSARKRGLEYTLTREEFIKLTSSNCFYCGSEPKNICKSLSSKGKYGNNGDYIYNGIDRIDQNKGYIIENCVPCCKTCNWAKGEKTLEEFMIWIKNIVNFQANNFKG